MNPFTASLGGLLHTLPGPLREHFGMSRGTKLFEGTMMRIWRREGLPGLLAFPTLWIGSRLDLLFTETGSGIPFRLENRVYETADGQVRMDWIREFSFPSASRRFAAVMRYEEGRGIVDDLGRRGSLEVELHPEVDGAALVIRSGRQWLRLRRLRIPIPAFLAGEARVREWVAEGATYGIRVEVWNPLLGCVFGYEGTFREVLP